MTAPVTEPAPGRRARAPLSPQESRRRLRAILLLAGCVVVIWALDQGVKAWVVGALPPEQDVPILGDLLIFHLVRNSGAAFSLASGATWIFSILAVAVAVAIVWFAPRIRSAGWAVFFGLLLGGNLGNLTDRLFREPGFGVGHVVDFVLTPWLLPAIYNIADVAIVSSVVLFVFLTIFGVRIDGSRSAFGRAPAGAAPVEPSAASDAPAEREAPAGPESPAEGSAERP